MDYTNIMDTVEINEELKKVTAIHGSLDETNPMTFVILLETNRTRFNQAQILWIEDMIRILVDKQKKRVDLSLANIDVDLAKTPILEKSDTFGTLKIGPQ